MGDGTRCVVETPQDVLHKLSRVNQHLHSLCDGPGPAGAPSARVDRKLGELAQKVEDMWARFGAPAGEPVRTR
jgi:hypothetical protein